MSVPIPDYMLGTHEMEEIPEDICMEQRIYLIGQMKNIRSI